MRIKDKTSDQYTYIKKDWVFGGFGLGDFNYAFNSCEIFNRHKILF